MKPNPACITASVNDNQTTHKMGYVTVGEDCMPQMTSLLYPGKMFVRPLSAYRAGFVYGTPHPSQFNVTYKTITTDMSIAHFTETIRDSGSEDNADVVTLF